MSLASTVQVKNYHYTKLRGLEASCFHFPFAKASTYKPVIYGAGSVYRLH